MNDVTISSIFTKGDLNLTKFIRKLNKRRNIFCNDSNFHCVSNNYITRSHLIKDEINLNDNVTYSCRKLVDFINNFIFEDCTNVNSNKFWLGQVDPKNVSFRGKQMSCKFFSDTRQSLLNSNYKQWIINIKSNGSFSNLSSIRIENVDKLAVLEILILTPLLQYLMN